MNKQRFIKIVKDYDNIPDEDRNKLHDLAKIYPYSQIIHTLIAKANHDAHTEIAVQTLHYAALYTSDRSILKDVIQHSAGSPSSSAIRAPRKEPVTDQEAPSNPNVFKGLKLSILESDGLRNEILLDLQDLQKSKAIYLQSLNENESISTSSAISPIPNPVTKATAEVNKVAKASPKPKKVKSKEKKVKPEKKTAAPKIKKGNFEEQNKLIEQFITKEHGLKVKPVKSTEDQPDLSESSTSFNEDLISENLAQILVKQGKVDKAIDIYKKLIWKFPQKKSYFASQIDVLQK